MVTQNAGNIGTGASGKMVQGAGVGSALTFSTPTYPSASGSAGKILRSDGTNNVYSTATYPDTAGASSNLLTSDGTNWVSSPPPTPGAGGGWFLIQTLTATNSATISFTTGITTTYKVFAFLISDVVPVTDQANFQLLLSVDGGATYLNSNYAADFTYFINNSTALGNIPTTTYMAMGPSMSNSTSFSCNANLWCYNIATAIPPYVTGQVTWNFNGAGGNRGLGNLYSMNSTTTGVNAFRFQFSTGNISTGTFSLYGIKS